MSLTANQIKNLQFRQKQVEIADADLKRDILTLYVFLLLINIVY